MLRPIPTVHTLQLARQRWGAEGGSLWGRPTRSRAPRLFAWPGQARAAGSRPIGTQSARVLARTPCTNTSESLVFFDIFIRQHRLKSPSSMIEIEHIFDEEAIDGQGRDEDLIDPRDLCTCLLKPSCLLWGRGVEPQ